MVILHVVAPAEVGGLERVVELLAQEQARAGADVHVALVLSPGTPEPALGASLAASGVTPHNIMAPGRTYWRDRAAVLELCARLVPDVVHTHGYRPDIVAAAAARRAGIPVVSTAHGFTGGDWKNRLYERLQRWAFRRLAAVIAVSRPLREQLIRDGIPADRIHVVQNVWRETAPPFDRWWARHSLGMWAEGFKIGWVGRLSGEKGADVLLDALVYLRDLPVTVSIVGDGNERQALRARARRLGVERQLQWHGMVPEMARNFSAFDAFVLSSRTEGTPIVLFEAMAAGVPIVATRVGGVPDVVSPTEAALVPSEDPPALAAAIRAVYDDREGPRARAQRARERLLTDFAVSPWIRRYDAIYRLVNNKTPAAASA